ncbi:PepSY domain-containing protein [Sphingorhabdus soli]|uniref:PepSY domain-containing protein n=1 Tax=Flavisphingopyxis soli TaxID=2601267 RepID=A0A5C6UMJ0_9SPHN|nr:PepSY-associated TM helix domain-containing protein [Sphingorhabdus soli]TXC73764.1 PepSY domain-containing protein [Sphingorhabdus soli]
MRLLSLLHRWTGASVGLFLAVIAMSGTALLWKGSWIGLPGAHDKPSRDPVAIGQAVAAALKEDATLSRMTFAGDEIGLHQAIYRDGGGAYFNQAGEMVDRWQSIWGRPELWLFDLHHYLFFGEIGEYVTGALGVLLLAFTITGLILWWRTRRTFRLRLWPARMTKSAIVRQHRDIGVVASPLLLLAGFTGTMMVFSNVSTAILSPLSDGNQVEKATYSAPSPDKDTDWPALVAQSQQAFPGAAPRRLMMPSKPGDAIAIRLKQDFEWTPNGRSYVYLDPASRAVLETIDPARSDTAAKVTEKYYPIHAGKVGGLVWRLTLTSGGVVLALLGTLAMFSFWFVDPGARSRTTGPGRIGQIFSSLR